MAQAQITQFGQAMAAVLQYTQATGNLGMQTSLYTAAMAYQTALIEAQGTTAQIQMDQMAAAANVIADLENLGMRNVMGLASKAQEMGQFIAQYREKMLNMFISIQESRSENTWSRIKKISQGFKF